MKQLRIRLELKEPECAILVDLVSKAVVKGINKQVHDPDLTSLLTKATKELSCFRQRKLQQGE